MTYFLNDLVIDEPENEYFVEFIQENLPTDDFIEQLDNKYPGWYAIKFPLHQRYSMRCIKNWLQNPDRIKYGRYKMIDWKTSRSDGYIILFENAIDVIKFNLTHGLRFFS
jgi:hypothetical protein